MITSQDDAVFFGIGLKNTSDRATGNNNMRRRRGFNEPIGGADRHERDEQDGGESSRATQSEGLGEESQDSPGTNSLCHKPTNMVRASLKGNLICSIAFRWGAGQISSA